MIARWGNPYYKMDSVFGLICAHPKIKRAIFGWKIVNLKKGLNNKEYAICQAEFYT